QPPAIKTHAGCFAPLRQERSTITPNVAYGQQPLPPKEIGLFIYRIIGVPLFDFRFFEIEIAIEIGMAIERKEQATCTKRFVVTVFQKEDVVFCGFEKTDFDSDFDFDFENVHHTK
ncbi:MAG: hypothetical protein ACQEQN_10430, partial [Thermodesulfobacteriota bacterium]